MFTLRQIIKMLRDKDGWRLVNPNGRWLDDEATYRETGIYTYLDCGGVKFRKYAEDRTHPSAVVYDPNPLAGIVTAIFTGILRRYLKRKLNDTNLSQLHCG